MQTAQRAGADGSSRVRTLSCPMQLKLEPRSSLLIIGHHSTVFPPHCSLLLGAARIHICSTSSPTTGAITPDGSWLRSPTSSHSVLQLKKKKETSRKRITGGGNPFPAFPPHHTASLTLPPSGDFGSEPGTHPAVLQNIPARKSDPLRSIIHTSRAEVTWLSAADCPIRSALSSTAAPAAERAARSRRLRVARRGARAQRSLPESSQIIYLNLHRTGIQLNRLCMAFLIKYTCNWERVARWHKWEIVYLMELIKPSSF